jgi:hypothetical protein
MRALTGNQRHQVTDSAADLKKLLAEIFDDQIVEPRERETLAKFTQSMSTEETRQVFQQFLQDKWGEVIADDRITGAERRLLGHIMTELNLTVDHLPAQARMALKDVI